ncbi:MAG TPA: co-chaperone GroES [Ignavibacteriaceae bacterium]|jgi:chaperonin GroES|nr:MAG: 10 kDa chaperonin [Ignavibacteria bacterium ADurb.Bin266]OQY74282.1 MAG: co-chaperone GroES [Ignavibacteriales bacterium UTCHB2]HQF42056.1 co-chaperone GroES [Ignavibacteriaceae bacterium]HQI40060.1 co-chaperone GroES [Ignavibacteriaceae bacterium]HQJ45213.1 co-chaperone GroES [Ignavibacteriaceae bacterium]
MKIKPLDDRILLEPLPAEEKTSSGLIIPDTAKEKPRVGLVIAVGTDEDLKEKIKEGDKVLFAKYGGDEIEMNGKEYRILQRSDILAVVED